MRYFIICFMLCIVSLYSINIYDVQYTDVSGDGTYPSQYEDQIVTISGVVTCNNYLTDRFFIADSNGGYWNCVFVYDRENVNIGDYVSITGEVREYNGLTEMASLTDMQVISSGNPVPAFYQATTGEASSTEALEGAPVELTNATVITADDGYGNFVVDDGSGSITIAGNCISQDDLSFDIINGMVFTSIKGMISYDYGNYTIHPRYESDFIRGDVPVSLNVPGQNANVGDQFTIDFLLNTPADEQIDSIRINIAYSSNIISYDSHSAPQGYNASYADNMGSGVIRVAPGQQLNGQTNIFTLVMDADDSGDVGLSVTDFYVNGADNQNIIIGDFIVRTDLLRPADEITRIQRPIFSVPQIAPQGSTFDIIVNGPMGATNWDARLKYADYELNMLVQNAQFDALYDLWTLTVQTPVTDIYALYDISVTCDQIETDIAENAVYMIPQFRDSYYIAHFTDTHLPGHVMFGDDPGEQDMTEVEDLRSIINDLNVIRPEFILFTGDVVNEGELEDLNDRRYYTIAKNLLTELDVPVFLVTGNHDVGGWQQTSPPAGTARNNWFRFFGWSYLADYDTEPNTQNYYFNYGNTLFIGMDSYDNYDDYRLDLFGNTSFTSWQLSWMRNLVQSNPTMEKVAFYHYDFNSEISLTAENLDMALWGHIHSNSGSIGSYPYDLATESVCDNNRAFRIVKFDNGTITPLQTMYAGGNGDSFTVTYNAPNNGTQSQNTAAIYNGYSTNFEHGLVKFHVTSGFDYATDDGEIVYQLDVDGHKEVAVRCNIPANGSTTVSVSGTTAVSDNEVNDYQLQAAVYPNPFNPQTNVVFSLKKKEHVKVDMFNLKGQNAMSIADREFDSGIHELTVSADELASGIYFIRISSEHNTVIKKCVLLK